MSDYSSTEASALMLKNLRRDFMTHGLFVVSNRRDFHETVRCSISSTSLLRLYLVCIIVSSHGSAAHSSLAIGTVLAANFLVPFVAIDHLTPETFVI